MKFGQISSGFGAILWIFYLVDFVKADVVCDAGFGYPLRYCYGITAYCCGNHYQNCCWQEIWKVWWFWVVAFVVITAIFSCCGYYCSSNNDGYGGFLRRNSSFNVFRRFSRYSRRDSEEEAWKPYRPQVELPPYSPSTSTEITGTSVDPNPPQNLPYLEPPPPYTTVVSRPQPESTESSNLLPNAPADAQTSTRNYSGTTTAHQ
uniref:Vesicular, overexpressed in cancer, prosurvival protein 1-like n=1 Tax=Phallusia mammillata TaxID=59560 RepID=A0A6F9DX52_9ASCI|nr:vesicular, overexpressed in cancer, prosurvival protein 1-like [Phallusia mammillata]